jgi:hypothetical protein
MPFSSCLDHVDSWLVGQRSLINARTRSLLPVLTQRQALADHLVRVLEKLGLDRVPRKVTDLANYLQQQYGQGTLEHQRTPLAPHEATEQLSSGEDQPTPGGNATS